VADKSIGGKSAALLLEFSNLTVGGAGSVGVIECLAKEVEECVQGFEPDSSSILRYIAANQAEGGPREAVDRILEARLVVGVTMGLCGKLVAQLDNPGTQFFGLTAIENWRIRKPLLGGVGTTLSCSHGHHLGLQLGEPLFEGGAGSVRINGFQTHYE